ncbi:hypothetical protein Trydic_g23237 [Trypoxylus dichotomus]
MYLGMAGKFPDSHNINHLRENLFNKVDMVSADFRRWKPAHPEIPQRTGKLFDIHKFDPGLFGITSVQTEYMDPMIRMALECAIEAVIDAGHHPSDLEHTNTAVFVGVSFSETEKFTFYEVLTSRADAVLGTQRSMIAKRIGYCMKLKGPSYSLDTACSSSLYATEHAYRAIKEGHCDRAIVCELVESFAGNFKAVKKYQHCETDGFTSSVTLFKAKFSAIQKMDADYGLSKIFLGGVDVFTIEGDHVTILESDDLPSIMESRKLIKPTNGNEVVITGMAGKFPDSHNINHLRENLFNKVDMISADFRRWKPTQPEIPQRTGKLFDIHKFDPGFFGITSVQTGQMDPMIRMALECAIEAVIDAGHHPSDLEHTNTAVFVGASVSDTEKFTFYEALTSRADAVLGTQRSMIAKRISYCLKLKAPAYILDTACSSSIHATEHAYIALKEGLCDKAIVCGLNLCLSSMVSLQFSRLGVLSQDGSCKSFDDSGNGYVRSEAVVVTLLERAKDARRIYCEVIHAKTNSDGYKKESINFPSAVAQETLMKDFYDDCKIDPTIVTYVEAHASGTIIGDPQELKSLDEVYCKRRDRPLHIGAIKSNIGHAETASGLCSIVKLVIAMETGYVPPNLHYNKPRKGVKALEEGRMVVVTEKMPLSEQGGYFAVNNFGFGGSNAHIVLHWHTKAKIRDGTPEDDLPRLICVSGRNKDGVKSILNDFRSRKCDAEHAYLIHQVFRKSIMGHFYRGYGIYNKSGEVKRSPIQIGTEKQRLYLIFSHFDEQWLTLGPALMKIPIFAKAFMSVQNILREARDASIVDIGSNLKEGDLTNPILETVAVQMSLTNILKEMKLSPDKIVGIDRFGSIPHRVQFNQAARLGYVTKDFPNQEEFVCKMDSDSGRELTSK